MKFYANLHLFQLPWHGINYVMLRISLFLLALRHFDPKKNTSINCNIKVLRGKGGKYTNKFSIKLSLLPLESEISLM
jgi:hypothetical protein